MAEGIENAVSDKKYIGDKDKDQLDLCYPPIVQSGGNYKLKFSHQSDKENIHFAPDLCGRLALWMDLKMNGKESLSGLSSIRSIMTHFDRLVNFDTDMFSRIDRLAKLLQLLIMKKILHFAPDANGWVALTIQT